jgi:hypothetical protein
MNEQDIEVLLGEEGYEDYQASRMDPDCCELCGLMLDGERLKDSRTHYACWVDYMAEARWEDERAERILGN